MIITVVCEKCKKEKELDRRNFVFINRGNDVDYISTCRDCIRRRKISETITSISNRRENNKWEEYLSYL